MNWEAIGAAGEVLGAVAVVATLLYVSRQLREQNRALSTTVRDSAFQQLQAWNYEIMADARLAHLYAAQPGCRHFWEHRRGSLDDRFVSLLENLDPPTLKTGLQITEGSS